MSDLLRWAVDIARDYAERRIQEWHNEECEQTHLLETPHDYRSYQEFQAVGPESPMFAKMGRVEQDAVLFGKMVDEYRNGDYLDTFLDDRAAFDTLLVLRDKHWDKAVENIRSRAEVHHHHSEALYDQKIIIDPQTEFSWTITLDPGEDIGWYVDQFPHEALRQVADDEEFADRHMKEADL